MSTTLVIQAEQVWISKKYGTKSRVVGWSDAWDMWEMDGPHGRFHVHGWDLRARYDLEASSDV